MREIITKKDVADQKANYSALEEAKTRRELADAASTEEYIVIRKISTLIEIMEASRPTENRGIGSETTYEPCFTSPHMLDVIEVKMLELIKKL